MSKQLEHIIKKFLTEQARPKLTTQAVRLNPDGVKFIKTEVCPKLGIDPIKVDKMDLIYGLRIVIDRKGEATPTGEIEDTTNYSDEQLQKDVLSYLDNSIGGTWAQKKSSGWFWFVSKDLEKSKNNKDEKRRARYSVICTYVNASLINEIKRTKLNSSTTGWLKTFKQGGLVFDLDSISESQWKVTAKNWPDTGETVSIGDINKGSETPPVLDLKPDQLTTDDTASIIVPEGGFKAGLQDSNEFYKVQSLMLQVLEKNNGTSTPQYLKLKTALNTEANRGDYYKSTTNILGATQQVVKMLKVYFKYKDIDPNIITKDFIDFLKSKI